MTSENIRNQNLMPKNEEQGKYYMICLLQEIAAQLAEFNERCSQNCTPLKEKKDG